MSDWLRAEALIAELRARIVELEVKLGLRLPQSDEVKAFIAATEAPEKIETPAHTAVEL